MKYKRIVLKDRPFTLHVFHGYRPTEIALKLNAVNKSGRKFKASEFKMHKHSDAETHYLAPDMPSHYAIILGKVDIETIAHEVFHVVMEHHRYIGVTLDVSSEESFAYLFGYLIKEIHECF